MFIELTRLALHSPKANTKQTVTRIDSFQLCETEHFLYWGCTSLLKIRPSSPSG